MHLQLIKEIVQNGKVVETYKKDNDLLLNNFGKWLAAHFKAILLPTSINIITLIDRTGTSRSIRVLRDTVNINTFNSTVSGDVGLVGVVGSNGQAPNHSNFDMLNPIAGTKTVSTAVYSSGVVSLSFSHTPSLDQEVAEAGLVALWMDTSNVQRSFLLVRDSFPKEVGGAIPFTLTFTYNFILN